MIYMVYIYVIYWYSIFGNISILVNKSRQQSTVWFYNYIQIFEQSAQ